MYYCATYSARLLGWFLACALCLTLARASAEEAVSTQSTELGTLLARLASAPGVSAHFREEKKMALLSAPLVSEGDVYFTHPPALLRRVTIPEPSTILLRDGHLQISDASGQRSIALAAHPAMQTLAESFLYVLSGDRAALEKVYTMQFKGTAAGAWSLVLVPRDAALTKLLRELSVTGTGLVVKTLRLVESSGDVSSTEFSAVDTQRHFSDSEKQALFGAPSSR